MVYKSKHNRFYVLVIGDVSFFKSIQKNLLYNKSKKVWERGCCLKEFVVKTVETGSHKKTCLDKTLFDYKLIKMASLVARYKVRIRQKRILYSEISPRMLVPNFKLLALQEHGLACSKVKVCRRNRRRYSLLIISIFKK